MIYKEITCDVITKMPEYVTAHCISEDCAMGAGVVMAFRKEFPELKNACKKYVQEIREENNILCFVEGEKGFYSGHMSDDGLILPFRYTAEGKTVYNMFTKKLYWHNARRKMTYEQYLYNLKISLCAVRDDMVSKNETKLAMPKIGAGLDHCLWIDVKEIIYDVFSESDIEICICLWEE